MTFHETLAYRTCNVLAESPRSTRTALVSSTGLEVEDKALFELGEPSKEVVIMEATKKHTFRIDMHARNWS
jgi:hypothetical protein